MRVVCRAAPRARSSTRVRRGLGACVPRRSCSPQNERRPARMYGGRFYWERNKGGDVCAKFRPGRGSRQRKMLTTRRRPRASPTASTRRARCSASGYDRARHERWSPQVEQAARATSDRRAQHRGSVRRDVGRVSPQIANAHRPPGVSAAGSFCATNPGSDTRLAAQERGTTERQRRIAGTQRLLPKWVTGGLIRGDSAAGCLAPPLSSTGVYPNHNRGDCEKRDQRAQRNVQVHLFVRNKFRL